jgi:hypothetical protein
MEPVRKAPYKRVTRENWLQPDPVSELFVMMDHRDGSFRPMDGADWIDTVAGTTLPAQVPPEVQNAFEFTKGGLGYGYFYYPLATVVGEQALRVADFAIDRLFVTRAMEPRPRSMARRLRRLHDDGLINDGQLRRWSGVRTLRNSATHPDFQHVWFPADAVRTLRLVAELIAALPWPVEPIVA